MVELEKVFLNMSFHNEANFFLISKAIHMPNLCWLKNVCELNSPLSTSPYWTFGSRKTSNICFPYEFLLTSENSKKFRSEDIMVLWYGTLEYSSKRTKRIYQIKENKVQKYHSPFGLSAWTLCWSVETIHLHWHTGKPAHHSATAWNFKSLIVRWYFKRN